MADAATSVRDRAIVLCMCTSGLRRGTIQAVRYGDVRNELGGDVVLVPVYPEMKKLVHRACKNSIPYYTFFDSVATDALKSYLRSKEKRAGNGAKEGWF